MADQTNAEVSDERLRERLAEFIATEWDDEINPVVGAQWPQREGDDGYRGNGGYVAIQPPDVLARCREQAGRVLAFLDALNRRSVTSQASEGAWWKGSPEDFKLLYDATPEMIATSLEAQRAKLTTLPENWDGYGAHPIVPQIVDTLLSEIIVEGGVVDIVPGSDGSVQAEWHRRGVVDVEYYIGPDGKRELYVKVVPLSDASPVSKRVERLETANRALAEIKESFRLAGLGTIGAHWQTLIDTIDQALGGRS